MADATTTVAVKFLADSSSVQTEAAKVEGTGSKFKSWAKGVGGAIAGAFAVDKLKDFVAAGSELQDQLAASQVIFGDAAKGVESWSKTTTDQFGISQSAAVAAANTFATFGKSAGLTGPDLAGFSENLTGLSGDLASFRGTSTEEAIEAVGAALRGETEPIRKYGVMLDDATLRNRAMAMGLTDTTKNALTPQQKVLAAQAEILAQTGDAQGDFARTSDSAANQQKKLKAEMDNASASIGTALLPVVSALAPILQKVAGFIEKNSGVLVPLVGIVAGVTAAVWLFNAALAANPIVLITIAIAALVAGLILAYQKVDWFRTAVDVAFAAVKVAIGIAVAAFQWLWDMISTVFSWIVDHWQLLLAILTGPFGIAVGLIITYWDQIWGFIQTVFNWIKDVFVTVVQWIIAPFAAAWDWIKQVPGWITGAFWGIVDWITNTFRTTEERFLAPFKAAWDWIKDLPGKVTGAFQGVIDWVKNTFVQVGDAFLSPFKTAFNAVADAWNKTIGSLSFSIPDWVPGIGGKGFDVPDMPHWYAKGGIFTRPSIIGVAERGPEAVIPLSAASSPRSGPVVVIEQATFSEQADIDLFMRRVAWAAQTERV